MVVPQWTTPSSWAIGWSVGIAVILVWLFHQQNFDDPYITYRYAVNLAEGRGFLYNVGERTISTTTPLYAILLVPVYMVGWDIPTVASSIGAISLACCGVCFWFLARAWGMRKAGMVGLVLLPTSPLLLPTIGGEIPWYLALILAGFLACAHRRIGWAALLFALATLTRADGVLATIAALLYLLCTSAGSRSLGQYPSLSQTTAQSWQTVLRLGIPYATLIAPWFVFAWGYSGSPFPATLVAKQHQALLPGSQRFLDGWIAQMHQFWDHPFLRIQLAMAAMGGGILLGRRGRPWLLVGGWNLLYLVGYTMLGVSGYFWYYGPLAIGLSTLIGLGIELFDRMPRASVMLRYALLGALLLAMAYPHGYVMLKTYRQRDPRIAIYREAGEWLRQHTPPDARVGTLEVGIIGYYAQRRMYDFAGLLQPETARQLTSTTSYAHAAVWVFRRYHPDYLVLQKGLFGLLESDPVFRQQCTVAKILTTPEYPHTLIIYACNPWSESAV